MCSSSNGVAQGRVEAHTATRDWYRRVHSVDDYYRWGTKCFTDDFSHLCVFEFEPSHPEHDFADCCVKPYSPEFEECIRLFHSHKDEPTLVGLLCKVGDVACEENRPIT